MTSASRIAVVILCLFLGGLSGRADGSELTFHIETVSPRCGQRGTTVNVLIQGLCLEDLQEVFFFRPGIKAIDFERLPDLSPPKAKFGGGMVVAQVRCKFVIAEDCPLGEHPFRLRTKTQLTSLGTFNVSPYRTIAEQEHDRAANNTPQTAEAVTPKVSINGLLKATTGTPEVDCYRVPMIAGQHLSVDVDCMKIAETHYGVPREFDLAVRILDESGRVLAANDDNHLHLQDPVVSFVAPHDGFAIIEVGQSVFCLCESPYVLHIGPGPRPMAAYPLGGPSGRLLTTTLLLSSGDRQPRDVTIPQQPGTFELDDLTPHPLRLRSCPYPNVLEQEAEGETRVSQLPIALNGIIDVAEDQDDFRLTVKEGDRYRVRVYARSLGTAIDPVLTIREASSGQVELEADDASNQERDLVGQASGRGGRPDLLDPSVIWQPKRSGDYVLSMTDRRGVGSNAGVYRVEIEPARDAIESFLADFNSEWSDAPVHVGLAIPQGGRWSVNMSLRPLQGNTYAGDLELVARGLPKGVRFSAPIVRRGMSTVPVLFTADAETVPAANAISVEVRPVGSDHPLLSGSFQTVRYVNWGGADAQRYVNLTTYALAVTEPAPFSFDVLPMTAPLVAGGELAVPIRIARKPGFAGPIQFESRWLPPGVASEAPKLIPEDETEAVMRLSADATAQLGTWPLMFFATTVNNANNRMGTGRVRVSSEIMTLQVVEPFLEFAADVSSVRRGQRSKMNWRVIQKRPFDGQAEVRLLGLPKGVQVVPPLPRITSKDTALVFDIEATDEALLGRTEQLSCEALIPSGSQQIRQRSGQGVLRIDPALAR